MALKYFYYVVVQSEQQAKFVTRADNGSKTVYWDKTEKPMAFPKKYAMDLAMCLNLNYYNAFVLTSNHEIKSQIFIRKEQSNEEK